MSKKSERNLLTFLDRLLENELRDIEQKGLLRRLRIRGPLKDGKISIARREVYLMCSNDYLGLSTHPRIVEKMKEAEDKWGAGSGASRLISGTTEIHREVEEKIARFKKAEDALFFTSGYHANVGIIQALLTGEDAVFSDELNHASIIDGCRLSRAKIYVYRHRDVNHLEHLLKTEGKKYRRRLVVTDTVFSMDGDIAPLEDIVEICEKYEAILMVDEAHATGIFGPDGAGMCSALNLSERVPVQMGTCSKALGVFGAYVAGSKKLISYLINRARSFIFTTAPPPSVCAGVMEAIDLVNEEKWRRDKVLKLAGILREKLKSAGFNTLNSESQIIPVVIGGEREAMDLSHYLFTRGFFVQGIRPPTVPPGTSRLRVTVTANLREETVEKFVDAISGWRENCG